MAFRPARAHDLDQVTDTITRAFRADPVWAVALARVDGRVDHHASYWRRFVDGAHEQGGVRLADDGAAVSVWIPPGGQELSAAGLEVLNRFNLEWLGPEGASQMADLYEHFDANHPQEVPHAYLSLLATRPEHRGRGIGQALLADDLARWDQAGFPAYLESTNPANDHRYERAGFWRIGGFTAVRDAAPISTMWRAVGGARLAGVQGPIYG